MKKENSKKVVKEVKIPEQITIQESFLIGWQKNQMI